MEIALLLHNAKVKSRAAETWKKELRAVRASLLNRWLGYFEVVMNDTDKLIDAIIQQAGSERSAIARLIGYTESLENQLNKVRHAMHVDHQKTYVEILKESFSS